MIEQRSADETGWARFSDDMCMRYRLSRALTPRVVCPTELQMAAEDRICRVVFVMLNPSTADAFKLDPTIAKCVKFAQRWGADALEVVNLFALRSPYPKTLLDHHRLLRGDDIENDREILNACSGAARVIAAWGTWGALDGRADYVRGLLRERHIKLEALRFTRDGAPSHPLARGKHFIPLEQEPAVWS